MRTLISFAAIAALVFLAGCSEGRAADEMGPAGAGKYNVQRTDFDTLTDTSRKRDVPRASTPPMMPGRFPSYCSRTASAATAATTSTWPITSPHTAMS